MAAEGAGRLMRPVGTALVVALAALTGACADAPISVAEFERTSGVAAPAQPARSSTRQPELRSEPPPSSQSPEPDPAGVPEATSIGFGDGAAVASQALESLGGERSLIEVTLYDGYGIVTAHEPASGNVDRVVVRGKGAEAPTPMPSAAARDPEAARFASADVNWQIVPTLVERTPTDLGIREGTVSHVIVEKNIPFSPDLVIRVYVTHPRGGGRIDYYAAGHPMRSFKD